MKRALLALALLGCSAAAPPPTPTTPGDPEENKEWQARQVDGPANADPAKEANVGSVIGSQAPGGSFKNAEGQSFDLSAAMVSDGAIVVFYRGHWCKQCRKQLAELQAIRPKLAERGFRVYAISTDAPELSAELKRKLGLGFEVLTDEAGLAIANWGVFTKVHELARPAVFVVAPGGRIAYRYVSDSPPDRPSVETLLSESKKARSPE